MNSKPTPNEELSFDDVYVLHDPLANQPLRLDPPDEVSKGTLEGLFRGEMTLSEPLELRASMGGRAMDILWGMVIPVIVISSRVVALFQEHGFTGWSTYPVRVFGRKGEPIEGYHGFAVTGRVGYRVFELSKIVITPPAVPTGPPRQMVRGLYFDRSAWDGSDIFLMPEADLIFIRGRVKKTLNKAKIRNIRFVSVHDWELPAYAYREEQLAKVGKKS